MPLPPFKVKAVYEYTSPHEDDLSFPNGQIITVTEEEDADWYVGEFIDSQGVKKDGLFPKNFVERYEPEPPPRPVRAPKPKQADAPQPSAPPVNEESIAHGYQDTRSEGVEQHSDALRAEPSVAASQAMSPSLQPPSQSGKAEDREQKPMVPAGPERASSKGPPPPVSEKPSSFKDRIAAFNKTAAPPIAPFKPTGPPSGFIKKPFVPPPPARDAYVPPPREPAPQKIYRREEDPDHPERRSEERHRPEGDSLDREHASVTSSARDNGNNGDTPAPTSLKDRIALLQKQQLEQAARQAEIAHKEKVKRPPPKRAESHDQVDQRDAEASDNRSNVAQADDVSSATLSDSMNAPPVPRHLRTPRSPDLSQQDREPFSDGNDADQSAAGETTEEAEGTSTGVEEDDEKLPMKVPYTSSIPLPTPRQDGLGINEGNAEEARESEDEEEDEVDAETRRRMELRERMAKMSGGMGMAGMFGPSGGLPMPAAAARKKKPTGESEHRSFDEDESKSSHTVSPSPYRIPAVPIPGMQSAPRKSMDDHGRPDDMEPQSSVSAGGPSLTQTFAGPENPQVKARADDQGNEHFDSSHTDVKGRQIPPVSVNDEQPNTPAVPSNRPVMTGLQETPDVPRTELVQSPSAGSESDDEMSQSTRQESTTSSNTKDRNLSLRGAPPPVPEHPRSPQPSQFTQDTFFHPNETMSTSQVGPGAQGRGIPLAPRSGLSNKETLQGRPPPPPPPAGAPPPRRQTGDAHPVHGSTEGETEYEGDYDTDIASSATHKGALTAHARETSLDDSTTADEQTESTSTTPLYGSEAVYPPPTSRPAPPPPPGQPPSGTKPMNMPRTVPPVPPHAERMSRNNEEEYDPYRYLPTSAPAASSPRVPPPIPTTELKDSDDDDEDLYANPTSRSSVERRPPSPPQTVPQHDRPAPPPPPHVHPVPPAMPSASQSSSSKPVRQSLDAQRTLSTTGRASMDQPRLSHDQGYIARDVDLGAGSHWWIQPNQPPPTFQNRKDVLIEIEESSASKRGGKTTISRDVYVLFIDYSQTIVTATFDSKEVDDVLLEQRHEAPPQRLRQDQLEEAHSLFGSRCAEAVTAYQNSVVGDGSPNALVLELLKSLPTALRPVGTRAYGALVYANLANATVQQYDEIRAGDIVTFRNAKFQGKHGTIHQKYSIDVGKPDHVGVVVDWDGTKKKVRAWEQGRESKKVKMESFKLGDLKSGEVRIWRLMGRNWVGWEGGN